MFRREAIGLDSPFQGQYILESNMSTKIVSMTQNTHLKKKFTKSTILYFTR